LVDNITDSPFSLLDIDSYCIESHWKNVNRTGICNLRAAMSFCIYRAPWLSGRINSCKIVLPERSKIDFYNAISIKYMLPYGDGSFPIRIVIDGSGSVVRGNYFDNFISTELVYLNGSDFLTASLSKLPTYVNDNIADRRKLYLFEDFTDFLSEIKIENITLLNFGNSDILGGSLNLRFLKLVSILNVRVLICKSNYGGGAYIYSTKSVIIKNSRFAGNTGVNGGGVFFSISDSVYISNSYFIDNSVSNIGGGIAIDSVNTIVLESLDIYNNYAKNFGGGISINGVYDSFHLTFSSIVFNKASLGSAIVLSSCMKSSISFNVVASNSANKGGTIYWIWKSNMHSPILINNSFVNNLVRSYGIEIATEAVSLLNSLEQNVYRIEDYDNLYPLHPEFELRDFYNQKVNGESNLLLNAILLPQDIHCSFNSDQAKLIGGTVAVVNDGAAKFEHLGAICIPGIYIFFMGLDSLLIFNKALY